MSLFFTKIVIINILNWYILQIAHVCAFFWFQLKDLSHDDLIELLCLMEAELQAKDVLLKAVLVRIIEPVYDCISIFVRI